MSKFLPLQLAKKPTTNKKTTLLKRKKHALIGLASKSELHKLLAFIFIRTLYFESYFAFKLWNSTEKFHLI